MESNHLQAIILHLHRRKQVTADYVEDLDRFHHMLSVEPVHLKAAGVSVSPPFVSAVTFLLVGLVLVVLGVKFPRLGI